MFKAGYVELMRLNRQRGEAAPGTDVHEIGEMENVAGAAALVHRGDDAPESPDAVPGDGGLGVSSSACSARCGAS